MQRRGLPRAVLTTRETRPRRPAAHRTGRVPVQAATSADRLGSPRTALRSAGSQAFRPPSSACLRALTACDGSKPMSASRSVGPPTTPHRADREVAVNHDGVLALAHCVQQVATAPWKKTFGHHSPSTFVDHGRKEAGSRSRVAAARQHGLRHPERPHRHRPPGTDLTGNKSQMSGANADAESLMDSAYTQPSPSAFRSGRPLRARRTHRRRLLLRRQRLRRLPV